MSPDDRARTVIELAVRGRSAGPIRAALLGGLADASGLHPTSVERLAQLWLASIDPAAVARWRARMGSGPAVSTAGIVAPGNLFVAT